VTDPQTADLNLSVPPVDSRRQGVLRVALAQMNPVVGHVEGNTRRLLALATRARDELGADLILFPELVVCGYPPEDLLLHRGMQQQVAAALERIRRDLSGIAAVVGYPEYAGGALHNSVALIADGEIRANYRKQCLPNYGVFDEKRYFTPGTGPTVVDIGGYRLALTICEDVWEKEPCLQAAGAGAEALLVVNGSPYDTTSTARRARVLSDRVGQTGLPLVYLNMVGGQDELIFDGGSLALAADGSVVFQAPMFEEGLYALDLRRAEGGVAVHPAGAHEPVPPPEHVEGVYRALVLGTRDYVDKHGFPGVVIGLSGGIDSALTLAIAVDALGADRVRTVMMPSRYTRDISVEDARAMADGLGVRYDTISIESIFDAVLAALADAFAGTAADATEENIQSRARGIILMALSNKFGSMVLTTGNKSEMAVGYATLYGDMAGGFAPIKDCSKTLVYKLSRYRNGVSPVIPQRIIERPPSAELAPDQVDTDSLPPYDVLDSILEAFIEEDCSVDQIVERGYDRATVGRVLGMVKRNEYKRRQGPPGIRISRRAFGRDWRYPITSGFGFEPL
jgi:NAD+ synthase (glutamine-hydrolysing)